MIPDRSRHCSTPALLHGLAGMLLAGAGSLHAQAAGTTVPVRNATFDSTAGASDNRADATGWVSTGSASIQQLGSGNWAGTAPAGGSAVMNNGDALHQDIGAIAAGRAYTLDCSIYRRATGDPLPDLGSVTIELLEVNGSEPTAIPSDLVYATETNGVIHARLTAVTGAVTNGSTLRLRIANDTPESSGHSQLNVDDVTLTEVELPPPAPLATTPKRYGSRPGTPLLLYLGAADAGTDRVWSASGLPAGINLDPTTGILSGTTPAAGTSIVNWAVTGKRDGKPLTAKGRVEIVSGDTLSLTPPVGWNSWNTFENALSEDAVKEITDAITRGGLNDYGFAFVNMDDNWATGSRAEGLLVPNPKKFPRGLNAVSDYVHAHGLKFGIYSDAAARTCAGVQPGSFEFEPSDAKSFADWGVDYLKYDYCGAPEDQPTAMHRYGEMGDMLTAMPRSIIFSVCEWGQRSPWTWAPGKNGNLWRTTFDMRDEWQFTKTGTPPRGLRFVGCLDAVDLLAGLESHQRPGAWNDPDMLTVGVDLAGSSSAGDAKGMNSQQEQSEYSMWAVLGAPLIFNADLRKLDPQSKHYQAAWAANVRRIVCNPEMLAVNQDPLGKQGVRARSEGDINLYRKPLADGTVVLALLNRAATPGKIRVSASDTGLAGDLKIRDLWMRRELELLHGSRTFYLKPHETRVFRCAPVKR